MKYSVFLTKKDVWHQGYGGICPATGDDGCYYKSVRCFDYVRSFKTLKGAQGWRKRNQEFKGQFLIAQTW